MALLYSLEPKFMKLKAKLQPNSVKILNYHYVTKMVSKLSHV